MASKKICLIVLDETSLKDQKQRKTFKTLKQRFKRLLKIVFLYG